MENVLEITGLTKSYGDFSLKEMNLAVPQGCIMGFIGQNGAGKTTTIQLILDIIKRDTGNIKVFGMDNIEKGSHIIGDLERIADMITFIDRGKILLSGNKEDILEKHGMMKCTKDDVSRIEKKDIVCVRQSAFETEVMVSDRKLCSNKYPDLLIESASLEEIMLFYVEKNRRNQ